MREAKMGRDMKARESGEVRFEDFQEELFQFLARRFGSLTLAERIKQELKKRVAESDALPLVGNPRVYLSSYGLSLGMQFLQEELGVNPHHRELM